MVADYVFSEEDSVTVVEMLKRLGYVIVELKIC